MRELNQYPARVIARVRAGETVDITDRGRTVARIVPVSPAESLIEELVRSGRATAPTIRGPFEAPPRWGDAQFSAADEVSRMRDED